MSVKGMSEEEYPIMLIPTSSKKLMRAFYKFWVPASLTKPEGVALPAGTQVGFLRVPQSNGGNF